jgi:uncharacterized membrane protein
MTALGLFHLTMAILALGTGAAVLLMTKGTRRHRQMGWVYVTAMGALNLSALSIYRLFGKFGPFHVFALISLASVLAGTVSAVQARRARLARNPDRRAMLVERHYQFMTWAYVGLCAAAVSEVATRIPAFRPGPGQGAMFGIAVGVASLVVMAVGGRMVISRRGRVLSPFARVSSK